MGTAARGWRGGMPSFCRIWPAPIAMVPLAVAMRQCIPVGNAILTVDTRAQALARAEGGINGKGGDATRACLRLVETKRAFWGVQA